MLLTYTIWLIGWCLEMRTSFIWSTVVIDTVEVASISCYTEKTIKPFLKKIKKNKKKLSFH
jgi:hypothetical protein